MENGRLWTKFVSTALNSDKRGRKLFNVAGAVFFRSLLRHGEVDDSVVIIINYRPQHQHQQQQQRYQQPRSWQQQRLR